MTGAFQSDAFQTSGFQLDPVVASTTAQARGEIPGTPGEFFDPLPSQPWLNPKGKWFTGSPPVRKSASWLDPVGDENTRGEIILSKGKRK